MRIGFDASPLVAGEGVAPGIRRVVECTLEALERRGRVEVVRLVPEGGRRSRSWRQRELPRLARGLAGIHSFLSAFPLRGPGKRVQTIHELPWKHGVKENSDWRHRLWARLGPHRADAVITASRRTAADLGLTRAEEGGSLYVVPWGVEERFQPDPPPGVFDEPLLRTYRLGSVPFVLALGAVRAKKNLAAALHGLARLAAGKQGGAGLRLVVTGADTPDLRRDLGLASRLGIAGQVSTPGEVPEEDLPGLLRLASAVLVLSPCEGFGLPALEATASGTPVIVTRGSAQAEVAGPLAFQVDPREPDEVAQALHDALQQREELRYRLPQHAASFTWDRTAEGIEKVWEALA